MGPCEPDPQRGGGRVDTGVGTSGIGTATGVGIGGCAVATGSAYGHDKNWARDHSARCTHRGPCKFQRGCGWYGDARWLAGQQDRGHARGEGRGEGGGRAQSEAQSESLSEGVIDACKNIDDLCPACPELDYNASGQILCCSICTQRVNAEPGAKFVRGANSDKFGIFKADQQQYKFLKHALKLHLQTAGHLWCIEQERRASVLFEQRRDLGLNVARTVYKGVLEGDSHYVLSASSRSLPILALSSARRTTRVSSCHSCARPSSPSSGTQSSTSFKCKRPETGRRPFSGVNDD